MATSSFVASHTSTATTPPEGQVDVGGWWPAIDLADLRKCTRIDMTVTPERLRQAVVATVCTAMIDLQAWQEQQVQLGYTHLSQVPAPAVDGSSVRAIQYRTAIYAGTQALLLEQYRDIDTTAAGERRAEHINDRTGLAWRMMRNAISDLLGVSRWTVEAL